MALSENQKKVYLEDINRARKKIVDITSKAKKDTSEQEKKILDLELKLKKG